MTPFHIDTARLRLRPFSAEEAGHVIAGSLIICAAGLFIFWREQAVGRAEPPVVPPP